jgi:hypothetical protein
MNTRLDDLHRKNVRKLRQGFRGLARDSCDRSCPADLYPEADKCLGAASNLASDPHMSLCTSNQPFTVSRTERSPAPENKQALQQRSLSGAIAPVDERQARWKTKLSVLDAAKVADSDFAKSHRCKSDRMG